jgi:heat shock protein HtpX
MGKRVFLFLLTNLAVVLVLSIVVSVFGLGQYISPSGQLQIVPLALFCFVWGMGGAFISLQMSRWIAKRAVGIRLVDGRTGNADLDWLHVTVGRLTTQAGLPMPEVGFYESEEVNAFATGPSKSRSLVAVSSGLLRAMDHTQVEAVLGHEVGHIANGDMVTMALLQGVINTFVIFLARLAAFAVRLAVDKRIGRLVSFVTLIAFEIGLGILGSMITAWYSRQREFRADAAGATLASRDGMISALRRLMETKDRIDTSKAALATMKIAGKKSWLQAFSTHPALEERIAVLEAGRYQ